MTDLDPGELSAATHAMLNQILTGDAFDVLDKTFEVEGFEVWKITRNFTDKGPERQ